MESLVDLFDQICSNPTARERVVLQDGDRQWTLAELDIQSKRLASIFIEKYGCRKGDCVGIYMNKCAEYVIAYVAALRAGNFCFFAISFFSRLGAAYLPLDISYPEELLKSVLDEVQPSVICTTENYTKKLPG